MNGLAVRGGTLGRLGERGGTTRVGGPCAVGLVVVLRAVARVDGGLGQAHRGTPGVEPEGRRFGSGEEEVVGAGAACVLPHP
ncbi:hypothetical protein GCM10010171_56150 [Actinokineospora fastidiosa]|uniref:Uncharacterized protein n=1 Tax=Actinokineospora fastidiosa TaxID=1816 RepID=A0A918GQ70_9PSEU|nr:hypothetical protein GCM10010171_56150 [Actinokineospora fastidiosa]